MSLIDLKEYLRKMIDNFSTTIDLEMTILNTDPFMRLAWTGELYNKRPNVFNENGTLLSHWKNSYTFKVIHSKKSIIAIDTQQYAKTSSNLSQYKNKQYYSVICTPILIDDAVEGVIVIASINKEQQKILIAKQNELLKYLENLSDLIASKAKENRLLEKTLNVKKELTSVVDTIQEGILFYSSKEGILHINPHAKLYLHCNNKKVRTTLLKEIIKLAQDTISKQKNQIDQIYKNIDNVQFSLQLQSYLVENDPQKVLCIINPLSKIQNDITQNDFEENNVERAIVYASPSMHHLLKTTEIIAPSPLNVLITGESGTGKELFARVIHSHSQRRGHPFVAVNCASIPENLLESELFGYENGAFTGARKGGKIGKFLLANHGTLFLDEIGELPLYMQSKLLRVLSEQQIDPIGSINPIHIDVRFIAATNKDLEKMMINKEFREDLYYRLNVIPLNIPPLRDRKEDIPVLVKYFITKYNAKLGKNIQTISQEALQILQSYDWPGNVRELENCVEYMIAFEKDSILSPANIPKSIVKIDSEISHQLNNDILLRPLKSSVKDYEKHLLERINEKYQGHPTKNEILEICKILHISIASYYRKLKGE